jgi:hypothetical protein
MSNIQNCNCNHNTPYHIDKIIAKYKNNNKRVQKTFRNTYLYDACEYIENIILSKNLQSDYACVVFYKNGNKATHRFKYNKLFKLSTDSPVVQENK